MSSVPLTNERNSNAVPRLSDLLGGVIMTINVSKCLLVVKHRNTPSLGPNENGITVENERSLGEELAQALSVTEERLARGDRKTVVSDEDDLAAGSWNVRKNTIKHLCLHVETGAA